MTKQATQQKEIKAKSISELQTVISEARETLRLERFKDKFSRHAGIIRDAKRQIARALTELSARQTTEQNSKN